MTASTEAVSRVEVSVIIPCRNAALFIGSLLTSLEAQDFEGTWEVVVVDNGSTDGSREIAEGFRERLPLRVTEAPAEPNSAVARQLGAADSRGAKLLFIDADDEVNPSYVRLMSLALDARECVAARLDIETLNPEWVRTAYGPNWQHTGLFVQHEFLPATGPALGVRRATYDAVGGHPHEYPTANDTAVSWLLLLSGTDISFVAAAVYRYRYRDSIRAIYCQSRAWGEEAAHLFQNFRAAGMPRRPLRSTLQDLREILFLVARWRHGTSRARLAVVLGDLIGRVRGSLRYRVAYI